MNFKLGIIPAGSTDCTAYSVHGVNDPITSALHAIRGDVLGLDVACIFAGDGGVCTSDDSGDSTKAKAGHFLRYAINSICFGFLGDLIDKSEMLRWLGIPSFSLTFS